MAAWDARLGRRAPRELSKVVASQALANVKPSDAERDADDDAYGATGALFACKCSASDL